MITKFNIWTDGACSPNPGKGGFCFYLEAVDEQGNIVNRALASDYDKNSTNNIMELSAIWKALQFVEILQESRKDVDANYKITVTSDSQYCINAFNKGWLVNWKKNNFTRKGEPLANKEIWKDVYHLVYEKFKNKIGFIWVRGHQSNECNNLCDTYAVKARIEEQPFYLVNNQIPKF